MRPLGLGGCSCELPSVEEGYVRFLGSIVRESGRIPLQLKEARKNNHPAPKVSFLSLIHFNDMRPLGLGGCSCELPSVEEGYVRFLGSIVPKLADG
jgi:hypothetical protein